MAVNPFWGLVKIIIYFIGSRRRRLFIEACKQPVKVQEDLKDKICKNLLKNFPEKPTTYSDYKDSFLLTTEKILFFEPTSGSSGAKKMIPYTRSLLKSFQNMFILWAYDVIFFSGIKLKSGKFFMSVSPQIGETNNDDRKYLSLPFRILLSPFLVSDPNDHKSNTSEEFLFKISKELISARQLEVISIWSPTYLLSIIEYIERNKIKFGLETVDWSSIWPNLKLISCWNHAQARKPSELLKKKIPGVQIQGKGLLLTEAPVTIPWSEANGHIPLIQETIIEFLEKDIIRRIDEVEIGKQYILLIGQHNGYLRYNTEDIVLVKGFYHKVPILEFMGRAGHHIDLAGEKFSESLLRDLTSGHEGQFFIVPDSREDLPRYVVITEIHDITDWDRKLQTIYHYKLARDLNQLKPVKLIKLRSPIQAYINYSQSKNMNLGDIKEKILFNNLIDAEKFLAWIEQESSPSL